MTFKNIKIGINSESDETLMQQIKRGSKKALGKLVNRHKKLAFRDAYGHVGNKDDAFDISQEAFIRVHNSAATFDSAQTFLPWFRTIIRNLSITQLNKRTKRDNKMIDLDDVSFLLVDKKNNPEQHVLDKEMTDTLGKALMKLDFEDREIIVMQHFHEMSYDEIAEALQIKKGTVMSRLYYARIKLAKLMGLKNE